MMRKQPSILKRQVAVIALIAGSFLSSCIHSAESATRVIRTQTGDIEYVIHSPAGRVSQRVILAHGFLRTPRTMNHVAESLAKDGIETACISLRRSRPWSGNHDANARDMIALRRSLGWKDVAYAGFSAGGLSALLAASEDPSCSRLLLLDPVDHGTFGVDAAPRVRVLTLAILGEPGPGNAHRNCKPMLQSIAKARTVELANATHCDFEARPSTFCHLATGSKPDTARAAAVHEALVHESSAFLTANPNTAP